MEQNQRAALETFLLRNPELQRIEALLSKFNVFDALGIADHELKHSDFLRFLLDPQENYGLGEIFLRRLLQLAISDSKQGEPSVSAIELEGFDLSGVEILREWNNIDILVCDEVNKFVVIIENKIFTGEHSDQLDRYWSVASREFRGWRKVGFYLTPEGDDPSSEHYLTMGYELVCSVLEDILVGQGSAIQPDVATFISHYTQMLRRHILSESEIAKLCSNIYKKHRAALDLIYEHRPDMQATLKEVLNDLILGTEGIVLDSGSKAYIRFIPKAWDFPELQQGSGWTSTGRILLFQFDNFKDSLKLRLYIGPGPGPLRGKLFRIAKENGGIFRTMSREPNQKWNTIFDRLFLAPEDYRDASEEDLRGKIRTLWQEFLNSDLPKLSAILEMRSWLNA